MQTDMAQYGHFLLKAHKETKVLHTPGPQYNDPHHRIPNSTMHNRRVSATTSKYLLNLPLQHLITCQLFKCFHGTQIGFSEIMLRTYRYFCFYEIWSE